MSEFTHRYGDYEHTQVLPAYQQSPPGPPPGRRGRRSAVGVLAGALLLGGLGGVAGAAGYDAFDDERSTPSGETLPPLRTASDSGGSAEDAPAGSPAAVAEAVLPSVVKINVAGSAGSGSGSGVILSENGEILTNFHVVEVAQRGGRMVVNFNDGSTASATVVGTDPVTDLAVIQADDVSGLVPATLGDSDAVEVGEGVVAVGSPFGLEATVTSGIVSSLNRPVTVPGASGGQDRTTYPAIQTDAAINPGNSGGPLVNLAAEVIGVNSSIRSSSGAGEGGSIGLGFAIPISKVIPIIEQLRAGETPTHAQLGVTVSNSVGDEGLVIGAGIESVNPGSAADGAGLEPGDVVTKVNDEAITSTESLIATIRGYRPGDEVELTVVRDGETLTVDATLDSDAEDG